MELTISKTIEVLITLASKLLNGSEQIELILIILIILVFELPHLLVRYIVLHIDNKNE